MLCTKFAARSLVASGLGASGALPCRLRRQVHPVAWPKTGESFVACTPSSMRSWEVVVSSLESFEASGHVALSHGMVYRGDQHGRKTS